MSHHHCRTYWQRKSVRAKPMLFPADCDSQPKKNAGGNQMIRFIRPVRLFSGRQLCSKGTHPTYVYYFLDVQACPILSQIEGTTVLRTGTRWHFPIILFRYCDTANSDHSSTELCAVTVFEWLDAESSSTIYIKTYFVTV